MTRPRSYSGHRPQLGAEAASYIRDLIVSGKLRGGQLLAVHIESQAAQPEPGWPAAGATSTAW